MTQIALKMPDHLLTDIDRLVESGAFPNRSAAVRSALEALVRKERNLRIDEAFAAGFAEYPETEEEMADATRVAIESIEDEPWEPWW